MPVIPCTWLPMGRPKLACLMPAISKTGTSRTISTQPPRAPTILIPAVDRAASPWMKTSNRLYVLTRFANQVEVIDLTSNATTGVHPLHNPEPQHRDRRAPDPVRRKPHLGQWRNVLCQLPYLRRHGSSGLEPGKSRWARNNQHPAAGSLHSHRQSNLPSTPRKAP